MVDAAHFESLVASAGRAADTGDLDGAAAAIGEALALWRGEPFVDLEDVAWAEPELKRLSERRLQAEEQRLKLLLQTGALVEVVPDAEALAARREPIREGPRGADGRPLSLGSSGRGAAGVPRLSHPARRGNRPGAVGRATRP